MTGLLFLRFCEKTANRNRNWRNRHEVSQQNKNGGAINWQKKKKVFPKWAIARSKSPECFSNLGKPVFDHPIALQLRRLLPLWAPSTVAVIAKDLWIVASGGQLV